jgi:hypothetical protein
VLDIEETPDCSNILTEQLSSPKEEAEDRRYDLCSSTAKLLAGPYLAEENYSAHDSRGNTRVARANLAYGRVTH